MLRLVKYSLAAVLVLLHVTANADNSIHSCQQTTCCEGDRGGISYCDASAGRYVCINGEYSSCYCTRHAVMDIQALAGCCLWHGGVMKSAVNWVICRDGSLSEACSLQNPPPSPAL
jgi:hypothetical protein